MTFGGPVVLRDAQIEGQMDMDRATVAAGQTFEAQRLHVGGIFSRLATFGGASIFQDLRVDASMDLQGSHVRRLDLAGTIIRGDLRFAERYPYGSESWLSWDDCDGSTSCLNLRNTRVENLQDDERAWPARITLEGFTYTHLGGIGDDQRLDMRNRLIDWWRDWLNRDPVYSAQPYAQLASVLAVAGNRDGAADIRFFGRDRERTELLRGCRWLQKLGWVAPPNDDRPCKWLSGVGLSAQQTFIGYGIGGYSFRAVWSALALVFVGMVLLFFAPGVRRVEWDYSGPGSGPRQKSALWCIGASLHRVLPLITISQEFSDFFNDPKRERLRPWQHAAFAVLALLGWVLAAFVAAAFSGLIQS